MITGWILIFCILFNQQAYGKSGFGGTEQDWGFVEVRNGAHMFWWLYYANPPEKPANFDVYSRPLIIWLQGGPGYGASGLGNFLEFGPLDINEKPRKNTWVNDYNVLLIDAPVGSGFSYADSEAVFNKNDDEIVKDIISTINYFLETYGRFSNVDTYIVGQSYGGRLAAKIAWALHQKTEFTINLKGLSLISPVISLVDSVVEWPSYAFYMGMIDTAGRTVLQNHADKAGKAAARNDWKAVAEHTSDLLGELFERTEQFDFNDVQRHWKSGAPFNQDALDLDKFMNNKVKAFLQAPHDFGKQSFKVHQLLEEEMMKPSDDVVSSLLTQTSLKIAICGGARDFVVGIPGIVKWIDSMFRNNEHWKNTPRKTLVINDFIEGYQKHYERLSFYWISRSGHQIPRDNSVAMKHILRNLIGS